MKFKNTKVMNFEGAFRGMRNPKESWGLSDSQESLVLTYDDDGKITAYRENYVIGEKDLGLAKRLIAGGSPHRKFLRQILVSVDISAPEYLWSQLDTYKVGTVANSTSKMHKLASTPITLECFETDDFDKEIFDPTPLINRLEALRQAYLQTKDKRYWKELVRWLPEGWVQTRTMTMNYEVIRQMCFWREGHKLSEWKSFIDWAHTLPYADDLIFYANEKEGARE